MSSDQTVSSKAVLECVLELQRQGSKRAMEQLEKVEPDLFEYMMETLTVVYQRLLRLGAPPRENRRVFKQVQTLVLVSVMALRKSHYELWQNDHGQSLQHLDPDHDDPSASREPK